MVIVGGGAAGAATAVMLARRGLTPIVLEALQGHVFKVGECLPPSANPILEQLGVIDRLERDGHLPSYGNRSVWGSPTPVERDFIFGTQGHGWHLDRLKFEAALAAQAREEGADWRYGYRLLKCSHQNERWVLTVQSPLGNASLEADFVVDATGRASRVARQLGAQRIRFDRLIGAALLLECQRGGGTRETFTLVEAVASGWWYSARLPSDKLMVVYMTDSDLMGHEVRKTDGWFTLLEETEHTMRRVRDSNYYAVGEPRVLSANSSMLDIIAGKYWLAVGDAASAFDPLSSYGISSAMGGGFYAASAIIDLFEGNSGALAAYSEIIDQAYEQYLLTHYDYYSLERRWPNEPFWLRRQGQHLLRQKSAQINIRSI